VRVVSSFTALLAICFAASAAVADGFFSNEDTRPRSAAFSHEERERIIADYYCDGFARSPRSTSERQQCELRRQAALRTLSERGSANHRAIAPHIRELRQMHDALNYGP
jgi:hypothetical protein